MNAVQYAREELERMGGYSWDGVCVHLKDGKCSVYSARPLVCRLFGVSELMKCEGCKPESYLSAEETRRRISVYTGIMRKQEEEALDAGAARDYNNTEEK